MNKVVIISGGNRGLGKALIDLVLKDPMAIIISISRSINSDHLTVDKKRFKFIKTDLADPINLKEFEVLDKIVKPNCEIIYLNNASIIEPIKEIGNFDSSEVYSIISVNINFPVCFINLLLERYSENKKILVNISSGAAKNPVSGWSLYGSSKAFINQFFNTLEKENYNNSQLSLFSIDPGVMDTGMQEKIRSNSFASVEYFKALKKNSQLIKPHEAAKKILNKIGFYQ